MTIELYKNTFVTLNEAQEYFDERYNSNEWKNLTQEEQEQLLVTASRKINRFDFVGSMLSNSQPMAFPRNFDMPKDIKDAVCEEAIFIVQNKDDIHLKNQENNISSISLGIGSVSYNNISNNVYEMQLMSKTAEYLVKKWTKKGFNMPC